MKSISLFSGMGGDTLGMEMAGCNVIAFNDFNRSSIDTHNANFPNCKLISTKDDKGKKRENGCTKPLYGVRSKCVLSIVPRDTNCKSFSIDKRCKLKRKK